MLLRDYNDCDEQEWIQCRAVSFLDCSYYKDVKTKKEHYAHSSISLVAQWKDTIVGLIDIELDSDELTYQDKGRGAMLWHLAVLPQHRHMGVARTLWEQACTTMKQHQVTYCELWTQEDIAANAFYQSIGFVLDDSQTWLRCYAKGKKASSFLTNEAIHNCYVEELVFEAKIQRKEELKDLCTHIDEVRLYTKML